MRLAARLNASLIVAVLIASLCFTSCSSFASAQSTILPVTGEYAEGTLATSHPFNIWYDWINTSNTQVIYYAAYTPSDYPFSVPVANLIGQHMQLSDGTEVFVASCLDGMEVYRDQNGNGIPEANFTADQSEILYFMYTNMSDSYTITPIEKQTQGGVAHYTWAFSYGGVYAYLQNAATHTGVDARFKLDHLTLSYDFSIDGNVSNLKTNYGIGSVQNVEARDPTTGQYIAGEFSFDGLSLALLYATATYSSKPYTVQVDGQAYNSSTTHFPASDLDLARIALNNENESVYDFVFGGNYTVSGNTYGAALQTYEAKAEAAATSSLPLPKGPTVWALKFFDSQLNLSALFGGSWSEVNANYEASALVYRICFPVWNGGEIEHDPVYVGYLSGSTSQIPEFPVTAVLFGIMVASVIIACVSITAKKTGRGDNRLLGNFLKQ